MSTGYKISVVANRIINVPGADPAHLFIKLTKPDGTSEYFRGGPNLDSDLGKIKGQSGVYESGTIDHKEPGDKNQRTIYEKSISAEEYSNLRQSFSQQIDTINSLRIPYNPLTQNSNSVVGTLLRNNGINITIDPSRTGMYAPAFDTQLINRSNQLLVSTEIQDGKTQVNRGDFEIASTVETEASSQASGSKNNSYDRATDVRQVSAMLQENAPTVIQQYGVDPNTPEGLGKAIAMYWKENDFDPKLLAEQLSNIPSSEIQSAFNQTQAAGKSGSDKQLVA
jgi:hypothetical protein